MARRGAAYTSLIKELDRRGVSALHQPEREQITDCADALLFDEASAAEKLEEARVMLHGLADSERWTEAAVSEIADLLEQVGVAAEQLA